VVPDGCSGLEIWLDYRRDIVILSRKSKGLLRLIYKVMTLGSSNISPRSLAIDEKVGWVVRLSAFLQPSCCMAMSVYLRSIKANPWWSSPLMPVVFIFSAMVSGIAAVMLLYMSATKMRRKAIDMRCVDTIAMYLFYIFIIDFSLEMLDLIHRIYEATSPSAVSTSWFTLVSILAYRNSDFLGTLTPLILLFLTQVVKLTEVLRKRVYATSGCLQ